MKPRGIAFTLYPVHQLAAARPFYEDLLGLTATRTFEHDGAVVRVEYDLGPHTLALEQNERLTPGVGALVAIEVEDFDRTAARFREAQVPVITPPAPHWGGRSALVRDPDGNAIAVHEREASLAGPAIVHQ